VLALVLVTIALLQRALLEVEDMVVLEMILARLVVLMIIKN
jgi:hypothetical protein